MWSVVRAAYCLSLDKPLLNIVHLRKELQILTPNHVLLVKRRNPMHTAIGGVQILHHCGIFISSYHDKLWVSFLESITLTPINMPKMYPYATPHI